MRGLGRTALVLALFIIAAAPSIVLADECDPGEPCKTDVTITGFENAPACPGPVYDGAIKVSNASSTYTYKVSVTARAENDSAGNPRCDNDPPDCSGQSCECDLSDASVVVTTDADKEVKKTCVLPVCQPCTRHCDNDSGAGECSPVADHCTCVIGTYFVTYYSDDEGENWTAMAPAYPTAITDKERNSLCADPGPGCD